MYLYPLEPLADRVVERLNKLATISDGFRLTEEDLALRGAGELATDSQVQAGDSQGVFPNLVISSADVLAERPFMDRAVAAVAALKSCVLN